MKADLLRSSIDTLKSVRLELHGNVESSTLEMLDKAIFDLENLQQDSDHIRVHKLITSLTSAILVT